MYACMVCLYTNTSSQKLKQLIFPISEPKSLFKFSPQNEFI